MKHTKHIIALLGVFIALSAPAHAIVTPFVRGGADFSKLNAIEETTNSDTWEKKLKGWKAGYFVEGGLKFLGSHTLAAEVGYMKAKATVADDTAGVTSREQVPVLLNYRMSFNVSSVSLFVGASAGIMSDKAGWKQEVKDRISGMDSWKTFTAGNWIGLWGASAGLQFKITKHWDFDLGVRVLGVNKKDYDSDYLIHGSADQTYKIGKNELYYRPNARFALSLHW